VATALAGCGVPAEDYDKVVNDLTAAQTQIQKLETELASAQNDLASANSEIDKLENEKASLQSELETAKAEYDNLQGEYDALSGEINSALEKAYAYEQILVELLLPAITGDELKEPFKISNVQAFVDKTDDATLKEKFDAWSKSPSNRTLVGELLIHALLTLEGILYH
jgi:chromosome segregation ATPase